MSLIETRGDTRRNRRGSWTKTIKKGNICTNISRMSEKSDEEPGECLEILFQSECSSTHPATTCIKRISLSAGSISPAPPSRAAHSLDYHHNLRCISYDKVRQTTEQLSNFAC